MREVQRSYTGPNQSQYQIDALESFKYPIYALSYSPEMYVLDYADHNEWTDSIARHLNDLIMADAGANTNQIRPAQSEEIVVKMAVDRVEAKFMPLIEVDKEGMAT